MNKLTEHLTQKLAEKVGAELEGRNWEYTFRSYAGTLECSSEFQFEATVYGSLLPESEYKLPVVTQALIHELVDMTDYFDNIGEFYRYVKSIVGTVEEAVLKAACDRCEEV